MSAHSVSLEIGFETRIFITAKKARELIKNKEAEIVGKGSFALRLKEPVVRWSERSGPFLMNGALLSKVRI